MTWAKIGRTVAYMVAPMAMVPALAVNVDWTGATGWGWSAASVGAILFSAVFFEASRRSGRWITGGIYILAGLFLIILNCMVAFDHASTRSDHRSDHRATIAQTAEKQRSQRSQWSQSRAEAATVARETPAKTIEAEIQQYILKDSRRYNATGECDPKMVTAGPSMTFCSELFRLRSVLEAARRRDDLDQKIADLDAKTEGKEVITATDPFAEGIANVVAIFGVEMSDRSKRALTSSKDVLRSLGLELVAAMGPTAWILIVDSLFTGLGRPMPAAPLVPAQPKTPAIRSEPRASALTVSLTADPAQPATNVTQLAVDAGADGTVPLDDPFHAFMATMLESVNGVTMRAGEPWEAWLRWCVEKGVQPGSQKAFGTKMKNYFAWESNNNRPRYLNVRMKSAAPSLRMVVNN